MKCSNAVYDFCINQGTDLTVPLVLTDATGEPVDLEGYTAAMQIRTLIDSMTAVDTLTTANGRILLEATQGKLTLKFPNAVTEEYPAQNLFYDIEITSSGGEITRILQGKVSVSPEVTRVSGTDQ